MQNKKNILVLNYEFPPLGGGQANANYHLFKEFIHNTELSFDLITSSRNKRKVEKFSNNITIHYLNIGKNGKNPHKQSIKELLIYGYKAYKLSKELIKKKKYDIIMCRSYPAVILGYLFNKFYTLPYISLLRGANVPFHVEKRKYLDKYIFQYLAPIFWKNSKHVIANSEQLKDLALKVAPKQQIDIITNGVNIQEYDIKKTKNKSSFNILYVGRLAKTKGIQELLKGFKSFSEKKDNVFLNIIGDGPDKKIIEEYIDINNLKEKIKIYGLVNHEKLKHIYSSNDVYILPSKNEGMSNTLLEAMASSLPVIITDVGGTKELFNNNGWIVNIADDEDINKKLELSYQARKEEKLEDLGNKSYDKVKDMSWENVSKKYLEFYLK